MLLTFVDYLVDVRHRTKCRRCIIMRETQVNNHPESHRNEKDTWDKELRKLTPGPLLFKTTRLRGKLTSEQLPYKQQIVVDIVVTLKFDDDQQRL